MNARISAATVDRRPRPIIPVFDVINVLVILIVCLLMILPFVHILAKSFSAYASVLAGRVTFWPVQFTTQSYEQVLQTPQFIRSFFNSVFVTVVGTVISMLLTILTAYPLSHRRMPFVALLTFLFVFTMFFNGGIIPTYLIVKSVGLLDTLWSLMLPLALIPFNLILLKTFFKSIPSSLEESARIDGATFTRILFQIVVPLSKPALATLSIFYAVRLWNDFFQALMYIQTRRLIPLQLFLREMIVDQTGLDVLDFQNVNPETVKAATIILAITPILLVYPFAQKYFVKGVMIGAVKG